MAISSLTICNSALSKLGASRISSLAGTTKAALLCNEQYSKLRDDVLAAHPWNFASTRAELSQNATAPTWGYTYAYDLPSDCLRVLRMEEEDDQGIPYKVEGRKLLTDASTSNILYIYQVVDTTKFTPLFAEVLAYRIAQDLGYAITQNMNVAQMMAKLYDDALRKAKSFDAQEGTPDLVEAEDWLDVRR
jgi:hypothetical protein